MGEGEGEGESEGEVRARARARVRVRVRAGLMAVAQRAQRTVSFSPSCKRMIAILTRSMMMSQQRSYAQILAMSCESEGWG